MSDSSTVIACGRALLGTELKSVDDALIVLRGDRIEAAGPRAEVVRPDTASEVDAGGFTLAPGFIDAHVHVALASPMDVVRGGVTTARDLAWRPNEIWPLVRSSKANDFEGPTLLAAGQMITVADGYPTRARWAPQGTGRVVRSLDDARDAVDEQADSGACVIKVALDAAVGPTLDATTLAMIVDRARDRHLRVTAHIYGLAELHKALDAGVAELAHMLLSPEPLPASIIDSMVEARTTVVPTLSTFFGEPLAIAIANLRAFVRAGGRFLFGTDLGNEGPKPGIDTREVRALRAAGLRPLDIVRAATVTAADYLEPSLRVSAVGELTDPNEGLPEPGSIPFGVIVPGARADLIALEGDLENEAGTQLSVGMVWRRGIRFR